jgi:ribosomal protein L15
LGRGDVETAFQVEAHSFSKTAIEKIEKAGGSATKI